MDTIVSDKMTKSKDTLTNKLLEIKQLEDENHAIVMQSLETVTEILTTLNKRVSELEARMSDYE